MKDVYIIDEAVDNRGGVQRTINTLTNQLYGDYNLFLVSLYKTYDEPNFEYNKDIMIEYFINEQKFQSKKYKKKSSFWYTCRIFEKVWSENIIKFRYIKKFCKKIFDDNILIFGRVDTALEFLKYFYKYDKHPKIIVRDAIHLTWYSNKKKKKMIKYFPDFVDYFIVSSEESINEYKDFFDNKGKLKVVKIYNPLGIIPKKCGSYNYKKIVSMGRMYDDQKGFRILIKSFVKVKEKYPDWKLEIYGNGRKENEYRDLIKSLKLENTVFIKSSSKNVVDTFSESSIFVLASRYEGYANILVEAMACGMPCITCNWLNGADDIIVDKTNGILINLKDRYEYFKGCDYDEDIDSFSNAIIEAIDNKEYMEKMSNEAMKIIKSRNKEDIIRNWKILIDS